MNTKEYVEAVIEKVKNHNFFHCINIEGGNFNIWFYSTLNLNYVSTAEITNIMGGHWELKYFTKLKKGKVRYRFINYHIEEDVRNYYLSQLL